MEQRFRAAVFDLDGTLLDTSAGVLSSVRYTIEHFGLIPPEEEQLKKFIGPPIQDSFAKNYGLSGDILQEIATVFRNRYKERDLLKAVPYKGIYEVFETLVDHGIKPAIATYKRQDYATEILVHFGFHRYTDIMYGADHENRMKKNDIIRKALHDAGVTNPIDAVMVGDSDNDAIGAELLGVKFIGVTYGFGFNTEADVERFPHIGVAQTTEEISRLIID